MGTGLDEEYAARSGCREAWSQRMFSRPGCSQLGVPGAAQLLVVFVALAGALIAEHRPGSVRGAWRCWLAFGDSALGPSRGGREQAQGAGAVHCLVAAVDAELGI